jgi:UDP-N-acetylmuramoyl-tripeptide--D-alanyl-D-alanine ligase
LDLIKEKDLSDVYLVGEIFTRINANYQFQSFAKTDDLLERLNKEQLKNFYILIKGSRGIQLERVIEKL